MVDQAREGLCYQIELNVLKMFSRILYGHGKLDLRFVHGGPEKCVGSKKVYPKKVYTSEVEAVEFGGKWFV